MRSSFAGMFPLKRTPVRESISTRPLGFGLVIFSIRRLHMRPHGQTKLGFFPLPIAEAKRLQSWLTFPERFSALDLRAGLPRI